MFPQDLSRQELDKYIADHPEEKDALLSPYTVLRRDGDRLVAVPYHEAYSQYVMPAADLLDLNSRIDLDIGPIESYDDHLTGQKAFYQANVMIVDQEASKDPGPIQTGYSRPPVEVVPSYPQWERTEMIRQRATFGLRCLR